MRSARTCRPTATTVSSPAIGAAVNGAL